MSNTYLFNACLLVVTLFTTNVMAWFDCTWSYRTELTITENSGSTLTNYQVRLDLDASYFDTDYVWTSDGRDLRILDTDDTTELEFFIESWNSATQTAVVWLQFDTLAANSNRLVYLYAGNPDAIAGDTILTFEDPGIKFNTRFTTANPSNKTQAFNFFNSAPITTAGYGCTFITNFTGVTNRNQFSPPSRNGNFIAYSESFFEVLTGEEGIWEFRYGGDFGRGGALYVNDIALEEQWTDDLWWGFNWGAAGEVLQGTINLTAGFHKLEVIGAEGCCDGGITVQYRRPGGSFQTFQTSTINVVSRKCPVTEPTNSIGAMSSELALLNMTHTTEVIEDPINLSANPKAIPGARVRMTQNVFNTGPSNTNNNTLNIVNAIPDNMSLYVTGTPFTFTDGIGTDTSGLSFNYIDLSSTSDDVEFSNDNAISFTYSPTPNGSGADASVTHIRISPKGQMNCAEGTNPNFELNYELIVN